MICFTTLSTEIYKRALPSVVGLVTEIVPDKEYTLLGELQVPALADMDLTVQLNGGGVPQVGTGDTLGV